MNRILINPMEGGVRKQMNLCNAGDTERFKSIDD